MIEKLKIWLRSSVVKHTPNPSQEGSSFTQAALKELSVAAANRDCKLLNFLSASAKSTARSASRLKMR